MKPKLIVKITVDFLMMLSLLALMSYELIGAATHELIGASMLILFVVHIYLNWNWWRNITKGKYTTSRIVQTLVNFLIFAGMMIEVLSGMMMSRYVFAFLPTNGGMSYARTLHMAGAYWSFVLMSVHLGFHGSMLMGIAKRVTHIKEFSRSSAIILRIAAVSASVYGIYAFIKRGLGSYMLLKNQFVFFDFNEPIILFFIDYFMIAALFACIGHCALQGIALISAKRKLTERDTL